MSSTHARRWMAVVAAATLGIGDLIVLNGIAAPAWIRSAEASRHVALPPPPPPTSSALPAPPVEARAGATIASATSEALPPGSTSAAAAMTSAPTASLAAANLERPPAPTSRTSGEAPAAAAPAIEMPLFAVGSAEISDKARPPLLEAATRMKSDPRLSVLLRGHTDSAGEESFNDQLSLLRARAAQEFLVASGVSRDRVAVVGLGARELIDPADTPEARARNRRVEIVWKP